MRKPVGMIPRHERIFRLNKNETAKILIQEVRLFASSLKNVTGVTVEVHLKQFYLL